MKKILSLIIAAISITSLHAFNPLSDLFINREWDFIEDQFIIQANNRMNELKNQCARWIPAIAAGAAAGYATDRALCAIIASPEKKHFDWQSFSRFCLDPSVGFASLYVAHRLINSGLQAHIDYDQLQEFVSTWPDNKRFTPQEFHSTFDLIYSQYIQYGENSKFKQQAPELIRLVKNAIYRHFPSKYEHELKDSNAPFHQYSFLHTIVTFDIARIIEAIVRIIKAFGGNSDY